jgi:predicted TIM-barrel fold metal-dependent hydrolase
MERIVDIHTHPQWERPVEQMAHILDRASRVGTGRIVVLGGNLGFGYQPTADQVTRINDVTALLLERWPERLIAFCRLNPGLPEDVVVRELERCMARGFRGIKLAVWPNARSPKVDCVMEFARERSLPVLHHCWYKTTCKYEGESDPSDMAHLAARFPDVTIIVAHLSAAGYRGIQDIRPYPNLLIDTSGSQCFSGIVEYAVSVLGAERILFGSDVPGRDFAVQLGRVYGAKISEADQEKILYGNAERLLGPAH